jgi:acetyl esterase/lipase
MKMLLVCYLTRRLFGPLATGASLPIFLALFLFGGPVSAVTVVDGVSYSSVNPTIRVYRAFYPEGVSQNAKLPIVVFVHGGGWYKGSREDESITPSSCTGDQTIACWLADHGYVVYDIDYTLVVTVATAADLTLVGPNQVSSASYSFKRSDIGNNLVIETGFGWPGGGYLITSVSRGVATLASSPASTDAGNGVYSLIQAGTYWPAQWQDCNCFLRYLAENAGVNIPGDPNNIQLMGQSAGGQLVLMMGMSGNSTYPPNCDHSSTRYTVQTIMAASPPSDLQTLYPVTDGQQDIRNFLGCVPDTPACTDTSEDASPVNYVGENQPFVATFSGSLDTSVPPSNPKEIQAAYSDLRPPVYSPWTLYPGMYHPLDMFFSQPCSGMQEPSPCGSAGMFLADAYSYMQEVGENQPQPGSSRLRKNRTTAR